MSWYECAGETVGRIVSSGGVSYICSNENGAFAWKEIFDLKLFMIALALLFFLPAVLKKLGVIKIKQKRKR
jgi:hypothetical protein